NADQAEDILINFSELIQYHVYDCPSREIALEKEIRSIRNFVYLQKMKFPPEFRADIIVTGEEMNQQIPPLIFMSVIENIFKYGFKSSVPNSFLKIDFT